MLFGQSHCSNETRDRTLQGQVLLQCTRFELPGSSRCQSGLRRVYTNPALLLEEQRVSQNGVYEHPCQCLFKPGMPNASYNGRASKSNYGLTSHSKSSIPWTVLSSRPVNPATPKVDHRRLSARFCTFPRSVNSQPSSFGASRKPACCQALACAEFQRYQLS